MPNMHVVKGNNSDNRNEKMKNKYTANISHVYQCSLIKLSIIYANITAPCPYES